MHQYNEVQRSSHVPLHRNTRGHKQFNESNSIAIKNSLAAALPFSVTCCRGVAPPRPCAPDPPDCALHCVRMFVCPQPTSSAERSPPRAPPSVAPASDAPPSPGLSTARAHATPSPVHPSTHSPARKPAHLPHLCTVRTVRMIGEWLSIRSCDPPPPPPSEAYQKWKAVGDTSRCRRMSGMCAGVGWQRGETGKRGGHGGQLLPLWGALPAA